MIVWPRTVDAGWFGRSIQFRVITKLTAGSFKVKIKNGSNAILKSPIKSQCVDFVCSSCRHKRCGPRDLATAAHGALVTSTFRALQALAAVVDSTCTCFNVDCVGWLWEHTKEPQVRCSVHEQPATTGYLMPTCSHVLLCPLTVMRRAYMQVQQHCNLCLNFRASCSANLQLCQVMTATMTSNQSTRMSQCRMSTARSRMTSKATRFSST